MHPINLIAIELMMTSKLYSFGGIDRLPPLTFAKTHFGTAQRIIQLSSFSYSVAPMLEPCLAASFCPGPKLQRTKKLSLSSACLRLHSRDQGIDLQIVGAVETILLDTREKGPKSLGEPAVDEGAGFTPDRNLSFDCRPWQSCIKEQPR